MALLEHDVELIHRRLRNIEERLDQLVDAKNQPETDDDVRSRMRDTGLSPRELEVALLVARGMSNKAIARELYVADPTVKFHVHSLFRKTGTTNRTQLAIWVTDQGLATEQAVAVARSGCKW